VRDASCVLREAKYDIRNTILISPLLSGGYAIRNTILISPLLSGGYAIRLWHRIRLEPPNESYLSHFC